MLKIKLAKREKYVVVIASCIIGLFLFINFIVLPFFKAKDRTSKGIATKEAEYKEIAELVSVYQEYKKDADRIERMLTKRGKGFTLGTYLDDAAGKTGVKDLIKHMQPSKSSSAEAGAIFEEYSIEMKLEGINTDQLVSYLYRIENPEDLIFIKRISITDNKKQEGYLDAIIQVQTYQKEL